MKKSILSLTVIVIALVIFTPQTCFSKVDLEPEPTWIDSIARTTDRVHSLKDFKNDDIYFVKCGEDFSKDGKALIINLGIIRLTNPTTIGQAIGEFEVLAYSNEEFISLSKFDADWEEINRSWISNAPNFGKCELFKNAFIKAVIWSDSKITIKKDSVFFVDKTTIYRKGIERPTEDKNLQKSHLLPIKLYSLNRLYPMIRTNISKKNKKIESLCQYFYWDSENGYPYYFIPSNKSRQNCSRSSQKSNLAEKYAVPKYSKSVIKSTIESKEAENESGSNLVKTKQKTDINIEAKINDNLSVNKNSRWAFDDLNCCESFSEGKVKYKYTKGLGYLELNSNFSIESLYNKDKSLRLIDPIVVSVSYGSDASMDAILSPAYCEGLNCLYFKHSNSNNQFVFIKTRTNNIYNLLGVVNENNEVRTLQKAKFLSKEYVEEVKKLLDELQVINKNHKRISTAYTEKHKDTFKQDSIDNFSAIIKTLKQYSQPVTRHCQNISQRVQKLNEIKTSAKNEGFGEEIKSINGVEAKINIYLEECTKHQDRLNKTFKELESIKAWYEVIKDDIPISEPSEINIDSKFVQGEEGISFATADDKKIAIVKSEYGNAWIEKGKYYLKKDDDGFGFYTIPDQNKLHIKMSIIKNRSELYTKLIYKEKTWNEQIQVWKAKIYGYNDRFVFLPRLKGQTPFIAESLAGSERNLVAKKVGVWFIVDGNNDSPLYSKAVETGKSKIKEAYVNVLNSGYPNKLSIVVGNSLSNDNFSDKDFTTYIMKKPSEIILAIDRAKVTMTDQDIWELHLFLITHKSAILEREELLDRVEKLLKEHIGVGYLVLWEFFDGNKPKDEESILYKYFKRITGNFIYKPIQTEADLKEIPNLVPLRPHF